MKLAFANEIVFIRKKQASKAKTPEFYESECLEYARKTNKKFLGFVMPWEGGNTRAVFIDINDIKTTPLAKNVLIAKNRLKGRQPKKGTIRQNFKEDKKQARIDKLYNEVKGIAEKGGYKLIRLHGELPSKYKSFAECHCETHNETFSRNCRDLLHKGSVTCPQCLTVMRSLQNGVSHYKRQGKLRPVSLYINSLENKFIKFGVSISPELRLKQHKKQSNLDQSMVYVREFKDGWQAIDLEYGIKTRFKGKRLTSKDLTVGYTETREYRLLPEIIKFIDDYINLNPTLPQYIIEDDEYWSAIKDDFVFDESQFMFPDTSDEEYYSNLAELDLSPLETL
ncbi:TPA: hypothetical protein OFX49_001361 [Escherichia coli]|nr:hypothetical protein [Escherichia coli]